MEPRWTNAYADGGPEPLMDIGLLGPVAVYEENGSEVAVGGPRPRGLLALLALEAPGIVAVDRVLEELWGDADIQNRGAAMHSTVNRLRSAIGGDLISTVSKGYRLDVPAGTTDLDRFKIHMRQAKQLETLGQAGKAAERFRRALAQWRGPAMSDIREFEFAEQAGRSLEEERIAAVESLMSAMLADGRHDQVATELQGLVDEYPFRERIWELLMLSLYRAGRQAEALATFQDVRQRLGDELGVEPWPALVDLEERILLHDQSLSEFALAEQSGTSTTEYIDFHSGDTIIEEGAPASAIYWIEEGEVDVGRNDGSGGLLRPTRLGAGRYFGELATLFGTPQPVTVKAVTPTTVSVHDLHSLRTRMAIEVSSPPRQEDSVDRLRALISQGHYFEAHDVAATEIDRGDTSMEVRYLAILALARSGATTHARRRYEQYGLGKLASTSVSPELAGDIKALAARLDKDMALASGGASEQAAWAERSARAYGDAYSDSDDAYHAVNAATMWLLAGDEGQAETYAKSALNRPNAGLDGYWEAATEAEAALIIGDLDLAGQALDRYAVASHQLLSQRATTLKQLKLVCDLKALDRKILDPLRNPTVVTYTGHRLITEAGNGSGDETAIRVRIDELLDSLDTAIGFGSLAAGTDIISAEALLDRTAELNVVLPFPKEEFVRTSVAPAGTDWVSRFNRCLTQASSVEVATSGEFLNDPVLFDFCAQVAMGQALIRAGHLETEAHQVAVWDGREAVGPAGTARDVARWRASGSETTVIPLGRSGDNRSGGLDRRRHIRAIVIADFAGQSGLTDAEHHAFYRLLTNEFSKRKDRYSDNIVYNAMWGDRLSIVFDDVGIAARFANEFMNRARSLDTEGTGLARLRGVRMAAHAAPVFEGKDPLSGSDFVYGTGVSEAVLIETRTPPGEIYATRTFAALAVLSSPSAFECQYVGNLPTPIGPQPLYTLREGARRE